MIRKKGVKLDTLERKNPPQDFGEENTKGGISSLAKRLDRYAAAHERALLNVEYIEACQEHAKKRAVKLKHCGHWLVFRHYYTVDDLRLKSADFCKQHLLCPLCAIRRGAKFLERYLERYYHVVVQNSDLKPYLVTLTLQNGDSLQERYKHLRRALKRLTNSRRNYLNLKDRPFTEFAKAEGYVYSIEAKRGKNSGAWHPHVHMLWLCSTPPDQQKLSKQWHSITKDSFIVDVRPVAGKNEAELASGFSEVFKYALKFSDMSPADNWHAFEVMRASNLVNSGGNLRGVKLPENLEDELLDDLPYVDLFYKYMAGSAVYSCLKITTESE